MTTIDKPRRRTYTTGNTLPSLTTSHKRLNVAPDQPDSEVRSIRAFGINIRNRATTSVYVRENDDSDEIEIKSGENYQIFEPRGTSGISMRGESGGESVELHTVEAHNDFDFGDTIEGIIRTISHFFTTGTTDIGNQSNDFDLRTYDRSGQVDRRVLDDINVEVSNTNTSGWITNTWTVFNPANFDYTLQSAEIRLALPTEEWIEYYGPRLEIKYDGLNTWHTCGPRRGLCRAYVQQISSKEDPLVTGNAFNTEKELSWTLNFPFGLNIHEGDRFRLVFDGYSRDPAPDNAGLGETVDVQVELLFTTGNRRDP